METIDLNEGETIESYTIAESRMKVSLKMCMQMVDQVRNRMKITDDYIVYLIVYGAYQNDEFDEIVQRMADENRQYNEDLNAMFSKLEAPSSVEPRSWVVPKEDEQSAIIGFIEDLE